MTARIAILVEGATEAVLRLSLLRFLQRRLAGTMPKLDFMPQDGRLAKRDRLKRQVELLLRANDAVVALTDVYTGTIPTDFVNAEDAKAKMRAWVGPEPRFHPHAAQYEFEAWLLPYWSTKIARSDQTAPASNPESVNHQKPPSQCLNEVFRTGRHKRSYAKILDARKILDGQDLTVSAAICPELKAFLNTILTLSGGSPL